MNRQSLCFLIVGGCKTDLAIETVAVVAVGEQHSRSAASTQLEHIAVEMAGEARRSETGQKQTKNLKWN